MKNKISTLAVLTFPFIMATSEAAECVIDRYIYATSYNLVKTTPAFAFQRLQHTSDRIPSRYNTERCDVPAGSIITNVNLEGRYLIKPGVFVGDVPGVTREQGLPLGRYGAEIATPTVRVKKTIAIQSRRGNTQITGAKRHITEFNGLDLHNLPINVYAGNEGGASCNSYKCSDYLIGGYALAITYESPEPPKNCLSGTLKGTKSGNYAIYSVESNLGLQANGSKVDPTVGIPTTWNLIDSDYDGLFALMDSNGKSLVSTGTNKEVEVRAVSNHTSSDVWRLLDSDGDGLYALQVAKSSNGMLKINSDDSITTAPYSQSSQFHWKVCEL